MLLTNKRHILSFSPGTGEHGVGLGKKEFLVHELGVGTVQLMRTIKQGIDPDGLFNPDKVSFRLRTAPRSLPDQRATQLYADVDDAKHD